MVAHQILVLLAQVRILVGQPKTPQTRRFFCVLRSWFLRESSQRNNPVNLFVVLLDFLKILSAQHDPKVVLVAMLKTFKN